MKKNIIKSLLSLILSVSMLVTGLGLTVHASVGGGVGEGMETGVSTETSSLSESEAGEAGERKDTPIMLKGPGGGIGLFSAITNNLITAFDLTIIFDDNSKVEIKDENDLEYGDYEVDVEKLDAVEIKYGLTKPDGLQIQSGDTYTIDLPDFFDKHMETTKDPKPIKVGDFNVEIGTFIIKNGQVIITFNEEANSHDDQEFFVYVTGTFDTDVFIGVEGIEVHVPYSNETSFSAIIRAKKEPYEGQDSKNPGQGYILEGDKKVPVDKNPTHVDWTVRVNDSAEKRASAKVVDALGEGLALVADSFVVEKIIRDYQNNETKVPVPSSAYTVTSDVNELGFSLEFDDGNINHAYDITYTTVLTKPELGGQREFNNTANIFYDGSETGTDISDEFTGTWSETLPVITKTGTTTDDPHVIDWTVKYNYGKELLGEEVTLTDTLTHGTVLPGTVKVYEVDPDVDGNVSDYGEPTEGSFPLSLDANGKAYYITFSTSVPVGLNEEITNTIADGEGEDANKGSDSVTVNTIPTGGKVGEQLVDDDGNPYIEWTITMNTRKVDVGSIRIFDVFNLGGSNPDYLIFDTNDRSLFELKRDGVEVAYDTFSISDYNHEVDDEHKDKTGFELLIPNAGPHTYEFVYRTYYTVEGMNEPHLANDAVLLFYQGQGGEGPGIGEPIPGNSPDYNIKGPKGGIQKSGNYVHLEDEGIADKTKQYIQWSIVINESRILFTELTVKDTLTSENKNEFTYVPGSFLIEELNKDDTVVGVLTSGVDYALQIDASGNSFEIVFKKSSDGGILPSNAKFRISYLTSVDNTTNLEHKNEASLTWQGGTEDSNETVPERTSGIKKLANIEIADDGSKIINWTINFNSKKNVLKNVVLTDKYSSIGAINEASVKLFKQVGAVYVEQNLAVGAVTFDYVEGTFTVTIGDIDAVPYRLTYTSTLSADQEQSDDVSNFAKITYTGNPKGETDSKTLPKPELAIEKNATALTKPSAENNLVKPLISWEIKVNIGKDNVNPNNIVNLQDAVLKDIIPGDQSLLPATIEVSRVGDDSFAIDSDAVSSNSNSFEIKLPNGAYEYIVTFQTEILEYPAFSYAYNDEIQELGFDPTNVPYKLDRYFNYVELTNNSEDDTNVKKTKDDAYQDYFADGTNNNNSKTVVVNEDTENIDWAATVNPQGLTIKHAVITDILSKNQYYLEDSVVVKAGTDTLTPSTDTVPGDYKLVFSTTTDGNPSFTITFTSTDGQIDKPITISYSTRLNPELIGNITVSNKLKLTGGQTDRELSEVTRSTRSSQWSYGGGGSGRTLTFVFNKENPNEDGIPGVVFNFERLNAAGGVVDTLVATTDVDGKFEFLNVRAGRYIAREVSTLQGYIELTEPIYLIVGYTAEDGVYEIKITNSNWQVITSSVASSEGNVLTIVNQHKATNFVMEAEKTLEGNKQLTSGLFTFDLYKVLPEGTDPAVELLQSKTNDADGRVAFDAIAYSEPGQYSYQIRERLQYLNGHQYGDGATSHGITFDETLHNVTITVVSDPMGILTATVSYGENIPGFTNNYLAAPVSVELKASKMLDGQTLEPEQFSFALIPLDDKDNEQEPEIVFNTVDANGVGRVLFSPIEFTEIGTFKYVIREIKGSQGGINWDPRSFTVTVLVTDDGEGQLRALVTYPTEGEEDTSDYVTVKGTPPEFSNKYAATDGTIDLFARKTLKGQSLIAGQFEFELRDTEGEWIETATNDASGNVVFSTLTYHDEVDEGDHYYTIHEVKGSQGGMTYDETVFNVIVTVFDNRDGQLIVTPLYSKPSADSLGDEPVDVEVEVAVFENSYAARPTNAEIRAHKTLTGMTLAADQFEFELVDKASGEVIDTARNEADGSINFKAINYGGTGSRTYNYLVREVQGKLGGISYDSSVYDVKVHVTDNRSGNLSAKVEYPEETPPVFENVYQASPVSAVIEAEKTLEGMNLKDKQFSFELVDKDGIVLDTVKNKADGSISFADLDFDTAGEYTYTIREVKGNEAGIIYDETTHKVTVKVTDDKEGKLKAEVIYEGGKAPTFTNIFSEEDTGSQIPTEPGLPQTGEGRSTSLPGLALIVAGLALGLFSWQKRRPRKKTSGQ